MTKSHSRKRVVPRLNNLGGVRDISKKLKGSDVIFENREKLAEALLSISQAKVTDVVDWDSEGKVKVKDLSDKSDEKVFVFNGRTS